MTEKTDFGELLHRVSVYEDLEAYQSLYKAFYDRLFWFSYSFVKSKEAAEEIVSDAFVKIWQTRGSLGSIENFPVYIYTITKNISLNYITKHHKFPQIDLDEMAIDTISTIGNPEELFDSAELGRRIKQAITQLPPKCRLIFQLVKEDGLKPREVSAILGIAEMTIRNQLVIAAKKIAETLQLDITSKTAKKPL